MLKSATKWINKNLDFSDLLKSRIVLYFFVFLSIINLYTLATNGNGLYAAIFILTSFLTTFFSKNMIVVLCIGLVVSNILRQGIEIRVIQDGTSMKEGMSGKTDVTENMKEGIAEIDESDDMILSDDDDDSDKEKSNIKKSEKKVSFKEEEKEEPKPADQDSLNNTRLEYKRLLELQNKLIAGVTSMTPLLKEAQETFQQIRDGM